MSTKIKDLHVPYPCPECGEGLYFCWPNGWCHNLRCSIYHVNLKKDSTPRQPHGELKENYCKEES